MKGYLTLLSMVVFTCCANAQTTGDISKYTDFLPPPPNASAIIKNGELTVNKNTGAPNVSIPLFSITGNKISTNIALSYSSTGIKVDELASRAGLGWALNIGGVVTRTVRQLADEKGTRLGAPWAPLAYNWSTVNFISDILDATSINGFDAQPDLFSFNFNGYAGSFVFDDNNNIVQIARSDIRIYSDLSSTSCNFRFVTPEGASYYFGGSGATEKTKRTSSCGKTFDTYVPNAWYLTKIEYPTGEVINFNYISHNYNYETGTSQTVFWVPAASLGFSVNCPGLNTCATPPTSTCINTVITQGVLLKSIVAPGKIQVNIQYQGRLDCEDSLFSRIEQVDLINNKKTSSYEFVYDDIAPNMDFESGSGYGIDHTPFLVSLRERSSDELLEKTHAFTYLDPGGRAPRLSYAQDHWGYFNGKDNLTLTPLPDESILGGGLLATLRFPGSTADRSPDSMFASKGLLAKVTYPTGGYDRFVYESNREYTGVRTSPRYLTNAVTGTGLFTAQTNDSTFTVPSTQNVELAISCIDNSGTGSFDPLHNSGRVEIVNSDGDAVFNILYAPGTTTYIEQSIVPGSYTLHLTANGTVVTTSVTMKFRPVDTLSYQNVVVGGVRVKKIISSASGNEMVKNYYYGKLESLHQSSLGHLIAPSYITSNETESKCGTGAMDTYRCFVSYLYANSINNIFDYQSGLASYATVTESIGNDFAGGGSETSYWIKMDGPGEVVFGSDFLSGGTKTNFSSSLNGKPTEEKLLKKMNDGSLKPVKITKYHYAVDERASTEVFGYVLNCRKPFQAGGLNGVDTTVIPTEPFPGSGTIFTQFLKYVDLIRYKVLCDWVYVDTLTEINYDEDGIHNLTNKTLYYYDSLSHTRLTRTETTDSKGDNFTSLLKYPFNFRGTAVYDSMISRNQVSSVIERTVSKNGSLLTTDKNNFAFYTSDIEIANIEATKQSGPTTREVQFDSYDSNGNLLQYTGKDGLPTAFIWNYNKSFPVAKTTNSSYAAMAYSSFEADATGNWDYSSGAITTDNGAVTGKKAYNLASANIQRTSLDASQTYVITYWLKDNGGSATVSGSGSPVELMNKNGWKLYRKEIQGNATVTISGSGIIDELRLYPKNARMTTFTYEPLIGVSTQCDENNRITFYEYDSFNRLQRIRDMDKNILKTFQYTYKEAQ